MLAMQTLKYRDVNVSASFRLAAANLADLVDLNIKEHCQPFAPLIKQLLPVHHDEGIHFTLRDQPSRDRSLAKRSGGTDEPLVMRYNLEDGFLLGWTQGAVKLDLNGLAHQPLVAQYRFDPMAFEEREHLGQTPARQSHMLRQILATGDNARLVIGGKPHGLRLVEFRILECSDSKQAIQD